MIEREDRRMIVKESKRGGEIVSNAQAVYALINSVLDMESEIDRDKEHFYVLGLNCKNRVQYVELVSMGTLTASLIHPRETYRLAVMKGVASIVCIHNHPSGDPTPSRDDLAVTERLKKSGEILGINLLDHIIIGDGKFTSLKEQGIFLYKSSNIAG
jgi:DNA repair protein RadC